MSSNMPNSDSEGNDPDEFLSVKGAARFLKMSPSWLYGSNIPFVRFGRSRRYRRRDLVAHGNEHLAHPKSRVGT